MKFRREGSECCKSESEPHRFPHLTGHPQVVPKALRTSGSQAEEADKVGFVGPPPHCLPVRPPPMVRNESIASCSGGRTCAIKTSCHSPNKRCPRNDMFGHILVRIVGTRVYHARCTVLPPRLWCRGHPRKDHQETVSASTRRGRLEEACIRRFIETHDGLLELRCRVLALYGSRPRFLLVPQESTILYLCITL